VSAHVLELIWVIRAPEALNSSNSSGWAVAVALDWSRLLMCDALEVLDASVNTHIDPCCIQSKGEDRVPKHVSEMLLNVSANA
jgi:hypothetical protein